MWRNYLIVSLRGFVRNKLFSFINVFGLAVGLACVILIGLYVVDELSYDRFQPNADRLYRISRDFYAKGSSSELLLATLAPRAAELLKAEFPEIEEIARTVSGSSGLITRNDVSFYETGIHFSDASMFKLFKFDWLAGSAQTALSSPNSIVLTQSVARKYFGSEPPLGQRLKLENVVEMTVTGVIRDLPENTHMQASIFMSLESYLNLLGPESRTAWNMNMAHTYVRLAKGADIKAVESRFPAFIDRNVEADASKWTGLKAMKVTDIHLNSTRQFELKPPGSMASVISLTTVAFGILLIACFNFMNLSTARSVLRGKEVGIRKTIGAERKHLVLQFLAESVGMTMLATLIAIALVEIMLPAFNGFTGKALAFNVLRDSNVQLTLVSLVLSVGCIAGSYPALYLSAFKPAQVLKSRITFGLRDVLFRNLLVVLQFSISIVLVIATTVVLLQTNYARNLKLGFDKERVVVLTGSPSQGLTTRWETLKQELLRDPGVVDVTASNIVPSMENGNNIGAKVAGGLETPGLPYMFVDYKFFETYAIKVLAGRTFSDQFPADRLPAISGPNMTGNFILNESAVRDLGMTPAQALDQPFEVAGADGRFGIKGRIVGVVADSNFESVRFAVKPLVFMLTQQALNNMQFASVRITGNDVAGALAHIDQAWQHVIPEFPASRRFLSESFEALYQKDTRIGEMFSYFAALAIVVACLGLFGLATFNAQRRTKEIGVRKVMGSSVWGIVVLLTSDFSKLVLLSNLIAWPVAYYSMNLWLQNFAYRIDLTPLVFIGSGLIALCIAWVTVGGTAAKAASQKPVLALRYE